ncbi:MAG: PhoH family protein [Pseudomonadota bacterium]
MTKVPAVEAVDHLIFDDNRLIADLAGEHDSHFMVFEEMLGVRIDPRGNRLAVSGPPDAVRGAVAAIKGLYDQLERGGGVTAGDVRAAATRAASGEAAPVSSDNKTLTAAPTPAPSLRTPKRTIMARSTAQGAYLEALGAHNLTFGVGPAGTGKTYLAVAHAVSRLMSGAAERIILSRPAVEAGEQIGFLPGDMKEKVDPYMRPLYDALYDMLHADYVDRRIASGEIEIAPLAFMRGRTLTRAAVILDEAQNATPAQMKMFLTRLGEGSHMAITGDPTQSDLGFGETSGLKDALSLLSGVEGVAVARFTAVDVVRHPLVARIIDAYDRRDRGRPTDV